MENPWLNLPEKAPYILPGDCDAITKLNQKLGAKNKRASLIHDEILPEPYVGNPFTASVVLLNLNPGFEESDRKRHRDPEFRQAALANLHHRKIKYPFYLLDPQFQGSGGARYWKK